VGGFYLKGRSALDLASEGVGPKSSVPDLTPFPSIGLCFEDAAIHQGRDSLETVESERTRIEAFPSVAPPLPPIANCGTITPMLKRKRPSKATPELFTTAPESEPTTRRSTVSAEALIERRYILPKDIGTSLLYLSEDELNRLARTVNEELARRNLLVVPKPSTGPETKPKRPVVLADKNIGKRPTSGTDAPPLTQSRINAIRAAFKAGVRPSTIARQFGVSRSAIQQTLSNKADG
jgi:hypothetical protein